MGYRAHVLGGQGQVHARRHLAEAVYKLGRFHEAVDKGREALAIFGRWFPDSNASMGAGLAWQALVQIVHRLTSSAAFTASMRKPGVQKPHCSA